MPRSRTIFADVEVLERPGLGMVVLRYSHPSGSRSDPVAVWSLGRLRKPTTCVVSGRVLEKGEEAYRPVGNHDYRMERIAREVIDAAPGSVD